MSKSVTIYTTAWCPYCARAKGLLTHKGVDFNEIDVESDPALRAQMMERSGRRTVPQIFIGDHHMGGCDDLHALDAAGGLDPLLAGAAP
jgi:glutaredoxin 3